MPHEPNEARSDLDADIARIEAMRDAGKVTADEAERLIAVLREIATAGADIDAIGEAEQAGGVPSAAPPVDPPPPSAPTPPPEPPSPSGSPPSGPAPSGPAPSGPPPSGQSPSTPPRPPTGPDAAEATAGTGSQATSGQASTEAWQATTHASRWLTVRILAGDVRIQGGDVDRPALRANDADVEMERDGDGWTIRDVRGAWFNRGHGTNVEVTVPREMGVALDVKAGNVRIRDVPAVRGKMMAGDLTIDGALAIDVHKSAGDLDAKVRLTDGRHRIRASAGDVNVTLLPGSDVAFQASVTMGDVRTGSAFKRVRSGMGGSVEGRVGAGTASLEVRLSAGNVRIRSEESHG